MKPVVNPIPVPMPSSFRAGLTVVKFIGTRRGDPERGPVVWINAKEARMRGLSDSEMAFVETPRRSHLVPVYIDERVPDASAVVRDLPGVVPTEEILLSKPDLDNEQPPTRA